MAKKPKLPEGSKNDIEPKTPTCGYLDMGASPPVPCGGVVSAVLSRKGNPVATPVCAEHLAPAVRRIAFFNGAVSVPVVVRVVA